MRISRVARLLVLGAAALVATAMADDSTSDAIVPRHGDDAPAVLLHDSPMRGSALRLLKKKQDDEDDEDEDEEEEEAPKKKKKKQPTSHPHAVDSSKRAEQPQPPAPDTPTQPPVNNAAPAGPAATPVQATQPAPTQPAPTQPPATTAPTPAPAATTQAPAQPAPAATTTAPPNGKKNVNDKRIKGNKKDGVIDHSSEGSAEIDKIDLSNKEKWISVYNDPPLLVIKASLYAFISYNNTAVCDAFNMTLNAVEQKADGNGTFEYHVVTYVNCTKNGQDETPGRFILNFVPEGRRLLLTECGHREENEILNWLKIKSEVPECMTPGERREFLAQSMKHIHAGNGTTNGSNQPTVTNFLARLENLDPQEVAIAGSATVALVAVIAVIAVFVMRKRKAQKDLERTIAGAKAVNADEDEDKSALADDDEDDKKKKKEDEGSFVNSPAVKV